MSVSGGAEASTRLVPLRFTKHIIFLKISPGELLNSQCCFEAMSAEHHAQQSKNLDEVP